MKHAWTVTYTNANGIPQRVRMDRDVQSRYTYRLDEWELGVRAAHHDDVLAEQQRQQRLLQQRLYG